MRSRRGFTLVEVLAGLLILSLVITTSLAVSYERERRLTFADETVRVYQLLANEAEIVRKIPWPLLDARNGKPFSVPSEIVRELPDLETRLVVEQSTPSLKSVRLNATWNGGSRKATVLVLRADTGGGSLW